MNALFNMEHIRLTTSSLEAIYPLFADKLGPDVEITAQFHMRDVNVLFSQHETDIIMEYTLCLSWKTEQQVEMYDEVRMISTMDLETDNDIMYITLLSHKLDVSNKFGQRSLPMMHNF